MNFIYGLSEPGNDEVRYVGLTGNMFQRLSQHLIHYERSNNTAFVRWMRSCKRRGLVPCMTMLFALDPEVDARAFEAQVITDMKAAGHRLTNSTTGPVRGGTLTTTHRARISAATKGRVPGIKPGTKFSAEHRRKISEGVRRAHATKG